MPKRVVALLMATSLCSCVAVWGRSYEIESATSEAVTIKYDRNFTTLKNVTEVARRNCAEIGKSAVKRDEIKSLWQINTVTFDCIKR